MAESERGKTTSPRLAGMRELEAQVRTCQLCKLARTRTNAVPGEGYLRTEVMFIGEAPGYHEDRQGRPFIGPAGQFLDELLEIAGLPRDRVYIANVVKCRPPNNRDPEPDEIAACAPYLERQIALINPRVIVTLGRFSMSKFFPGERISQIHGTARVVDGRLCVAMYHPAAGLHQASLADVIRTDFKRLPVYLEEARSLVSQPPLEMVEKRIEEAEAAREQVIHESQVGEAQEQHVEAVHEAGQVYSAEPVAEGSSSTVDVEPAAVQGAGPVAPVQPAQSAARPRKRKEGSKYKQMSFFDL